MSGLLVTGAGGFIGKQTLTLLEQVWPGELAAASRVERRSTSRLRWVKAELLDPDSLDRLLAEVRPDTVLHLAWTTEHGRFWTDPENPRWLEAGERLARGFAEQGGTRLVAAGSCAEYDWNQGGILDEQAPLRPATPYGEAKRALFERVNRLSQSCGFSFAWGRIFFPFGPGEPMGRFVPSVIRSLLRGEPALLTDGKQVRDLLHVHDVARAFVDLLMSPVTGPVNIGSGEGRPLAELAHRLAEKLERPELLHLGALPRRADEPEILVADTRRLREEIGFKPAFTLETGLDDAIAYWKMTG